MSTPAEIKITGEFASAMQQLSAEAEKSLPPNGREASHHDDEQLAEVLREFRGLSDRILSLETKLAARLEKLETKPAPDFAEQFHKLDEHMAALRNTESVNQSLFDSLHDELIKCRDNFLHESLQKPFIRDLVILYDDLRSLSSQLQTAVAGNDQKSAKLEVAFQQAAHDCSQLEHAELFMQRSRLPDRV